MSDIYTVGHSTHSSDQFMRLLQLHGITGVADVRSTPFSRRNPQFNRDALRATLNSAGIEYLFLGKELGARSEDDSCYVDAKVQYSLLAKTRLFESGIERVVDAARVRRIALMCAEKDPLECHRTILVARRLVHAGFKVMHILADGAIETHDEATARLIGRSRLGGEDLFRSGELIADEAYDRQADRIAFRRK
jgi:uncharacterized protein (DUF488 family)